MVSIYELKSRFQGILRPITRLLARIGITANQVTVFAALLSFATGACIAIWPDQRWPLLLVPGMLFIRMALNAIDGMLAREHDMKSNLGAILNELGDVLSDAALYLPLAFVAGFQPEIMVAIVVFAVIVEMTGVIAIQIGASRHYEGPMGKSDRAFVFGFICLLVGCGVSTDPWLQYVLYAVLGLLLLTVINRARKALAEVAA